MTPERTAKFKRVISHRQPDVTVVLEDVHDAHNISAVLRTCDSVGIMEIFVLYRNTSIEKLRLGRRSSASARKWVDVRFFNDIDACFDALRQRYERIYCTHLTTDAQDLYQLDLTVPVALVFGNEHLGVSADMVERCDGNFCIPQVGMVESLNISVACAVSVYELYRQRHTKGMYQQSTFTKNEQQHLFEEYVDRQGRKGNIIY